MPAIRAVLVVDDDGDVREALQLALNGDGFDVVTAENGAQALELIAAGLLPCVILLDLMMPVMSGWEFWDRREASPSLRAIPVVILTATGLGTGSVGDATILPKPINYTELVAVVVAAAVVGDVGRR